jgi:lysine 6-dehydrogenase
MPFSYIVLGAGRQGIAAAYDLARFGEASRLVLADADAAHAKAAADRVNQLIGSAVADSIALDVRDENAVARAIKGHDVVLSAVPYFYNLALTKIAIANRVSFCDLGGHTETVRLQHDLDSEAKQAGVRVVPDCGMGPGMGNNLAAYAMGLLDQPEHIYMFDGGLPQSPQPPWHYAMTFNIEGLTNEYFGGMTVLREGKLTHIPCFMEFEMVDVPPLGKLEAFMIAGGASTAPWSFAGKLQTYQLKVLRYPGTFAQLKAFSDLGLFDLNPIHVDGNDVVPRHVFHALFEPQVKFDQVKDVCIIRVVGVGKNGGGKNGKAAQVVVEIIDYYDPATGFTAMQRLTGWHLSIIAAMMAKGEVAIGSTPLELAVAGEAFVREARRRGLNITERWS